MNVLLICYRSPRLTLSVCLLIAAIFSAGLLSLQISSDLRDNFDADNADYARLKAMEKEYGAADGSAILLLDFNQSVFTPANLDALNHITHLAEAINNVKSIQGLLKSAIFITNDEDVEALHLNDLVDQKNYSPIIDIFAKAPGRYTYSPVISDDQQVTAIYLSFDFDETDTNTKKKITEDVKRFNKSISHQYPHITTYLTGSIIADDAQKLAAQGNMKTIFPIMYATIFVLLLVLLRNIKTVAMIIFVAFIGTVSMFGCAAFLGIKISPQSLASGVILTGITVATISHMLMSFVRYDNDYQDNIYSCVFDNLQPITFAGMTTLLGFLSMNLSLMPPLRDLGNTAAIGIAFSMLYSIVLFPCLLLLFPIKLTDHYSSHCEKYFKKLGDVLLCSPRRNFLFIILLLILVSFGNQYNKNNDYFAHYYDKSFQFRVSNDFADENLAGLYTLEFDLPTRGKQTINDAGYLEEIDRFKQWLLTLPEVKHVATIADVIKMMNRVLHNNDDDFYNVPENSNLIAQYFLLYEISLADTQVLDHLINVSRDSSRVIVTVTSMSSQPMLELEEKIIHWLNHNTTQLSVHHATGILMLLTQVVDEVILSGFESALVALFFISLIMIIVLRPLVLGSISLLPNVLPFIVAFGIWGFVSGDILAASTVVIAITLGIVVDDTIHYIYKVKYCIDERGLNARQAVITALQEVGPAILLTTVCLAMGFFVSSFSHFMPSVFFGSLATLILFVAFVLDVSILPLMVFMYFQRKETLRVE